MRYEINDADELRRKVDEMEAKLTSLFILTELFFAIFGAGGSEWEYGEAVFNTNHIRAMNRDTDDEGIETRRQNY